MSLPVVTVVIPAFNAQAYIGEAIASIRAQTLEDWELIVVDDGSTDDTVLVARQAAGDDARIRLIRFDRNQGISAASNAGFDAARGEFIARLDSDDRAFPERLAAQVAAFRENERWAAAGSHSRVFGDDVPDDHYAFCTLGDAAIKARLFDGSNTISGGTLTVRSAFVRTHRIRFDERAVSAEDLDYLLSIMIAGGELANVDQVLGEHRFHDASFTTTRLDLAVPGLRAYRHRLMTAWYPSLDSSDVDLVIDMWFELRTPYVDSLLATVRAVDRLVVAHAVDFGQDVSIVHSTILARLTELIRIFGAELDASHRQAIRAFVSPATAAAID